MNTTVRASGEISGKKRKGVAPGVCVTMFLVTAAVLIPALAARLRAAGPPDGSGHWLHVKVDGKSGSDPELVRVNVPLELAAKVLPAINAEKLRHGKVRLDSEVNGIDLTALLEAVRNTPDGEFITVRDRHNQVRVAKAGAFLVVKVREAEGKHGHGDQVDIKVPFTVAQALLSSGNHELDLTAAIQALQAGGDTELVSVDDNDETVRIWVDSRNTSD